MSNAEIFTKALAKAKANGYRDRQYLLDVAHFGVDSFFFSHRFAKAFWGVEKQKIYLCPKCSYQKWYSKHDEYLYCPYDGRKFKETETELDDQSWKGHLQQMVLEPEPLQYIAKFLKEDNE